MYPPLGKKKMSASQGHALSFAPASFSMWSGGRFMHFGKMLSEQEYLQSVRFAYQKGIRIFITSDIYGQGEADCCLRKALKRFPRDSYQIVGMIGHDFYKGKRKGSRGYSRFTDPELRKPSEYREFLHFACSKSLERCGVDYFDVLLLHNPDQYGYEREETWKSLESLKRMGMAKEIGIAPGPANGFTLDILNCVDTFSDLIDWVMLILNPLEPWPSRLLLPILEKRGIHVISRVVDYGGLFHNPSISNVNLSEVDHRNYRPKGWMQMGIKKMEKMRPFLKNSEWTMLQFSSIWNLSQPAVKVISPTFILEAHEEAKSIEDQITELASLSGERLSEEEVEQIAKIGDNTFSMNLKGANSENTCSDYAPDSWMLSKKSLRLAEKYGIPAQGW